MLEQYFIKDFNLTITKQLSFKKEIEHMLLNLNRFSAEWV